jgi:hypothetical protein
MAVLRPDGPLLTDAPWPVIRWGSDGGRAELALATIDPDRPLQPGEVMAAGGYALLTGAQLAGLVDFLEDHREDINGDDSTGEKHAFVPLDESELPGLGLADEAYPGHRQRFFLQDRDGDRIVLVTTMILPLPADVVELRMLRPPGGASGPLGVLLDASGLTGLQDIFREELQHLRT